MASIDLNADLGEGGKYDAELMRVVSSCNVACGGHAGDADSMAATVQLALTNGVAVGVHPSYPDRDGFGRRSLRLAHDELYEALSAQTESFVDIAAELGARVVHLKPHGALYNDAAKRSALADVIARVTVELPDECALVGPPGSMLEMSANQHGLTFIAEAFVDRAYRPDGELLARTKTGAVYKDIERMIAQALSLATVHEVEAADGTRIQVHAATLCVHGDTPGAGAAAAAIRDALQSHGIEIRAVGQAC